MKKLETCTFKRLRGFTLAELLIALAILGVIATFTIPKVLQSQASSQWKATAKETAAMVSGALQAYKQNSTVQASTGIEHLTPYMNYVRLTTLSSDTFDYDPGTGGTGHCASAPVARCLLLHNGGMMIYQAPLGFGTTQNTSAVYFSVDPDGRATGNPDSIVFLIMPNGRLMTWGVADSTIYVNGAPASGQGVADPAWFSWN